jgi:hypothetical protein
MQRIDGVKIYENAGEVFCDAGEGIVPAFKRWNEQDFQVRLTRPSTVEVRFGGAYTVRVDEDGVRIVGKAGKYADISFEGAEELVEIMPALFGRVAGDGDDSQKALAALRRELAETKNAMAAALEKACDRIQELRRPRCPGGEA